MKKLENCLNTDSLDAVSGGLSTFRLASPTALLPQSTVIASPVAIAPLNSLGALGLPAASSLGSGLAELSDNAVYAIDANVGTIANYAVSTNYGTMPLSTIARDLARSTGGAISYAGDLDRDGRIGAADFLFSRGIGEAAAMRSVGDIMDQLHDYTPATGATSLSSLGTLGTVGTSGLNGLQALTSIANSIGSIGRLIGGTQPTASTVTSNAALQRGMTEEIYEQEFLPNGTVRETYTTESLSPQDAYLY